ncbi:MAG: hypothetical protein V9E87_01235 [Gemmatimonadales bacterium]
MNQTSIDLLARLLDAPGPSGFERAPARLWREAAAFADAVQADVGGNSFATVHPAGGPSGAPRLMFAGHIDEIGVMLIHVDEHGFCYFEPIGGWDPQVFVGQRVVLLGRNGAVPGVIGKQAIHLMDQADRDKLSKPHDLWIDIGATSRDEALALVAIGDAGVLGSTVTHLPNGRIVSRSLDNRIGAFVVLEALRRLAARPPAPAGDRRRDHAGGDRLHWRRRAHLGHVARGPCGDRGRRDARDRLARASRRSGTAR